MTETNPGELADHLESEADDLEQRSRKLGKETDDAAQDWERKRSDPSVPGAPPPVEGEDNEPPTGAPSGKGEEEGAPSGKGEDNEPPTGAPSGKGEDG